MTTRRSFRLAALALAAGTFAAACGSGSDDATPATDPAPATDASAGGSTDATTGDDTATPAGEAPEILQFTNALVGGGELDAATLAGKPTAFWFWAPT